MFRFLLLLFSLIPIFSSAQSFKAKLKDLAFMSGTWTQAHQWGDMEEFWGEPMGDNMICSYRCVKNGKTIFYEFIVIEQDSLIPVMKLRHFSRGNISWEEKDKPLNYPLVALSKNEAVFEAPDKSLRMIYRRLSETKMDIVLEEKDKDGKMTTEIFNYSKKS
ncbi:MAG: hypothetical protein EOO02_01090 [Chitinophagaceae bacterium]|nr:MAG: hypothetical protein EOO02_01090 [Chitinophagaceae bacterium]